MFALAFLAGVWNVTRTGGSSDSSALYPAVLNLTISARDGDGVPTRITSVGASPTWSITAGTGAEASRGELAISLDDSPAQLCKFDFSSSAGAPDVFVSASPECTWMLTVPSRGVLDSSSGNRLAVTWSLNVAGGVVVAIRHTAKGKSGFWQTVRFVCIIVVVATVQIGTRWFIKKQRTSAKAADMNRRREANMAKIVALRKSQGGASIAAPANPSAPTGSTVTAVDSSVLSGAAPQKSADETAGVGAESAAAELPPPTLAPGSSALKTE